MHLEEDDARGSSGDDGDGAALRYAVTPGYLEAMRIPLRRGSLLDARDRAGAPSADATSRYVVIRGPASAGGPMHRSATKPDFTTPGPPTDESPRPAARWRRSVRRDPA